MAWVHKRKPRVLFFRYNHWKHRVTFKCPKCFRTFEYDAAGKCPYCYTELDFSMYYGG